MAGNLRDEHGNPIELIDEHGHPVKLTDEHGNPIRLSGVAYSSSSEQSSYVTPTDPSYVSGGGVGVGGGGGNFGGVSQGPYTAAVGGMGGATHVGTTIGDVLHGGGEEAGFGEGGQYQPRRTDQTEGMVTGAGGGIHGVGGSSPSSSSSEGEMQEGEGGVEGGRRRKKKGFTEKIKEKLTSGKHKDQKDKDERHVMTTTVTSTTTTELEHHEDHGKKGMLEKIKEKLPGSGHTSTNL